MGSKLLLSHHSFHPPPPQLLLVDKRKQSLFICGARLQVKAWEVSKASLFFLSKPAGITVTAEQKGSYSFWRHSIVKGSMIWSVLECFAPEADCGLLGKGGSQSECGSPRGNEQHHTLATSCLSPYKSGRYFLIFFPLAIFLTDKPICSRAFF